MDKDKLIGFAKKGVQSAYNASDKVFSTVIEKNKERDKINQEKRYDKIAKKLNKKEDIKNQKQENKSQKQADKDRKTHFKELTKGKPSTSMDIKYDSSKRFDNYILLMQFISFYQHEAGKVIIENKEEYYFINFSWTPNIVGQKNFSVGKALTGAALVGEIGLIAGAAGKKGEDKSVGTVLLKNVENGELVKMWGTVKTEIVPYWTALITAEEAGLSI